MLTRREKIILGRVAGARCWNSTDIYTAAIDAVSLSKSDRREAMSYLDRCNAVGRNRVRHKARVPTVRDWICRSRLRRYSRLVDDMIPTSSGAGTHDADVVFGGEPQVCYCASRDFDNSLPKSYRYRVSSSTVTVTMPKRFQLYSECGVLVLRDPRHRSRRWMLHNSGKYGLKLVHGFYFHGRHIVGISETVARRKAAKLVLAARRLAQSNREMARCLEHPERFWITSRLSLKAGNCEIGTDNWIHRFLEWLRPDGEVGAIRGDLALEYAKIRGDQYDRVLLALKQAIAS